MSLISSIALAVGTIPLLAYPMVLLAGVMSLCGHRSPSPRARSLHVSLFRVFIWLSLAYPAAPLVGWRGARKAASIDNTWAESLFAFLPLSYVALLVLLFQLVIKLEKPR